MSWLLGGLIVGVVVLGLVVGAYAVGYDRGQEAASSPAPSTETTDTTEATGTTETTETTETAPQATGAEVFASAGCGGCHVLADAGATGAVGPSLDELQPTAQQVAQVVTSGAGAMPSFEGQLSEAEIEAVAAYVGEVAGV